VVALYRKIFGNLSSPYSSDGDIGGIIIIEEEYWQQIISVLPQQRPVVTPKKKNPSAVFSPWIAIMGTKP